MTTQQELLETFDYSDGKLLWKKVSNYKKKLLGTEAGKDSISSGYKVLKLNGKMYYTHRLIFLYHNGYLPVTVDHIDGNKLNNNIENLREANDSQQQWNQKIPSNNKSGVKGVCWDKDMKKWKSYLGINWKRIHVGYFENIEEAKNKIEECREKYHQEFSNNG